MAHDQQAAQLADPFATHRQLLFAIAYNLLGSVSDAEDVVQDAWVAWNSVRHDEVRNPRAYLVRVAVNGAIGRLRDVRRARERYVGPWLPEPLLTEPDVADHALRTESLSLALMVVLETLTPIERAVFVLREAFSFQYREIAAIVDRSPDAVRQTAHRARERVRERRPRYDVDREAQRAATERFISATLGGDMRALVEVLAPDVALWSDGGGRRSAARRVIHGRDKVVRLLLAIRPSLPPDPVVRYQEVNGTPAALVLAGGCLYAVLVADLVDGRICGLYGVVNPDKLGGVAGPRADRPAGPGV
ncbi:RNA polymerase sigma-70 factor [Jidongwangia harbinensis]|uniref:RNA polymerase sigma-70 factor n=1 Tax=Jidongwangia harbinensis TaxID=2878561 RepID=UPI001CD95AE6|nr:RNA polymerase sigma-70 factor [Jidongwangia harbinensis]MCA2211634.1 RNA polymerase sigma-70 factor [Jidongwangia harbinensis]